MKVSQKGFSVVEILIVVVVVGLLGAVGWLAYDRQKSKSSQQANTQTSEQKQESTKQEPKTIDQYEGWKTYNNSQLGYSFKYPSDWTAAPINYGDKLGAIQLDSNDIKTEEWLIGATDVIKGSRVTMQVPLPGDYTVFGGLYKQLKDKGAIKPVGLTLGGRMAIEYTFVYEGPESIEIRLAMSDSQYIETSFTSEGKESAHPNYDLYKKVLTSIK